MAKVNKTQRVREGNDEEARKRREQVDLQRKADFTSEISGNSNNKGRGSHGFGCGIRCGFQAGAAFHTTQTPPLTFNTRSSSTAPDPVVGQPERGGLFGNRGLLGHGIERTSSVH